MIQRTASPKLLAMSKKLPIIAILGPRQSGKTTLAKYLFPGFKYVTLESPDNRVHASNDPRGFLDTYSPPAILDEIQKVPDLFSYLQEKVDSTNTSGQYVITGSQNFLLNEKISQSLAGRVYLSHLPPLTQSELTSSEVTLTDWYQYAFQGTYPRIWDKKLSPLDWYPSYTQTYLERDVRDLKQIVDLKDFQTFLKLCAGRIGQVAVSSSISNEIGVSHNTVKSWLSVLESSYLIFLLKPYYQNFNKRLVKSPKLYFYDTGLALNLLNITHPEQIETHPLRGSIFENLVISDIVKSKINLGSSDLGYYLKDKTGNEIDYVHEKSGFLTLTEVKAGKTVVPDHLKGIGYWKSINPKIIKGSCLIYSGDEKKTMLGTHILPWNHAALS